MHVPQALLERKSVRSFLDKPVSQKLIQEILQYARQSPSGTNTQPWEVAVVSGETKKILDKKLEDAFWAKTPKQLDYNYYPQLPLHPKLMNRKIECGFALYNALGIKREDRERRLQQWALNYSSFGSPVTLYFFIHKDLEKGSFIDAGIFMQSVMLMATHLGLATCAQAALAEYPDIIRQTLGYEADYLVLCGMALGYEDTEAKVNNYRTTREKVEDFTKFFN